jgi:hypothetical protein
LKLRLQNDQIDHFGDLLFKADNRGIDPDFEFIELFRLLHFTVRFQDLSTFLQSNRETVLQFLRSDRKDSIARFMAFSETFSLDLSTVFNEPQFQIALTNILTRSSQMALLWALHKSGPARFDLMGLCWKNPELIWRSWHDYQYLRKAKLIKEDADRVLEAFLLTKHSGDAAIFTNGLILEHGFSYTNAIREGLKIVVDQFLRMVDSEFDVLEICCEKSPEFANDFAMEVLRIVVLRDIPLVSLSKSLGRLTRIVRRFKDADVRLEKLAEIAGIMAIGNGSEKLPQIDELRIALEEDFEVNSCWGMALFVEMIEGGKFASPSVVDFIRSYAERVEVGDCEYGFDLLVGILENGEEEEGKKVVPVLEALMEARVELRERFVGAGKLENGMIQLFNENLVMELRTLKGE